MPNAINNSDTVPVWPPQFMFNVIKWLRRRNVINIDLFSRLQNILVSFEENICFLVFRDYKLRYIQSTLSLDTVKSNLTFVIGCLVFGIQDVGLKITSFLHSQLFQVFNYSYIIMKQRMYIFLHTHYVS